MRQKLLPALTGRDSITDTERELFALPIKFGGLGLGNPTKTANAQYSSSQRVTAPLTALILQQEHSYPSCIAIEQKVIKSKIKGQRREQEKEDAERVRAKLPVEMQRAMSYNGEKGESQWLGVLPLTEFGFSLHKGAFLAMGGPPGTCHLNVPVGSTLLWSMPSVVHLEASHHYDTMTSETQQPASSVKCAIMLPWSHL